jgi:diguanylate cyclase (GGDEF)-like protein
MSSDGVGQDIDTHFSWESQRETVSYREIRFTPVLICVDGPMISSRFPLTKRETVIGRNPLCDIYLNDDLTSRRHVRIIYENYDQPGEIPECYCEDLESRNGTEVNGSVINGIHRLAERDMILVGSNLFGFFLRDERELEREQALYQLATRDPLTGLNNRHQFRTHIELFLERARRYGHAMSLLVIDVDRFKSFNDTYGHDMGDLVLQHLARTLESCCRATEILARWGGEEFTVLMPDADRVAAAGLAERLRAAIESAPIKIKDRTVPITISIGGAQLLPGEEIASLFRRADQQLYLAKKYGRNRVMIDQSDHLSQSTSGFNSSSGGAGQ